ncbi:MAG TPA: hypothetical protein VGL20_19805 [Candidatus Dormibacteraeota bacterium]|jgi:hypothetical protein
MRRASLHALSLTGLCWPFASLVVAAGVVATGRWDGGYVIALARFMADEAGVGSCYVMVALAGAVGYALAQQRHPVLRQGFVESQIFAAVIFGAATGAALLARAAVTAAGLGLDSPRSLLVLLPVKVAAAAAAAAYVYPLYLRYRSSDRRP